MKKKSGLESGLNVISWAMKKKRNYLPVKIIGKNTGM